MLKPAVLSQTLVYNKGLNDHGCVFVSGVLLLICKIPIHELMNKGCCAQESRIEGKQGLFSVLICVVLSSAAQHDLAKRKMSESWSSNIDCQASWCVHS